MHARLPPARRHSRLRRRAARPVSRAVPPRSRWRTRRQDRSGEGLSVAETPTYAVPFGFLGVTRRDPAARFVVAGVPLDIGTTNRSGTREGPAAIRRASRMLVDGDHPQAWIDPAALDLADCGDLPLALGDIPGSLTRIESAAAAFGHLIALGGEHGITLPLLRALAGRVGEPLALVHFDAHVDTWPDNFGQAFAHGSVFYHAIRERLVDPARMIQVGIRSPVQRAVWDWTVGQGVTILSAQDVHATTPGAVADQIRAVIGDAPAYLSFDIDALDPAFAPGTGTPEIGGLASWQAQAILRRLRGLDFRGMDVVEVAPAYDTAEITALAGATLAWEYLALMGA
ncbi:MAG: agmatinase [Rhodospirillales bacterium]|nr:agmatinase [Rhodospirillales bacterium]MBN8906403.1 agmatinase [Rhodospirillales bacterium]